VTDAIKLADEIERMVTYADRTGQCAIGGMHVIAQDGKLIAAALRLSEAVSHEHFANAHRKREDGWLAVSAVDEKLAEYRAARDR
jgi:hypothetical protein